jgi:hypothetical protein
MRFVSVIALISILAAFLPISVRAEACADAPPVRLQADSPGQIVPGLRGLRLRALPAVGAGEVSTLNSGTTFTVIAGPSCNGGYNWWRVELTNAVPGQRGWLAEGSWSQYFVVPTENLTLCDTVQVPVLYAIVRGLCAWL